MNLQRQLCLLLLGSLAAGCGGGPAAQPADPGLARKVLVDTLDSWKGGDPPDASAKRTPPVRVADEEWKAGTKLLDYRVDGDGRAVVSDQSFPVTLTLEAKGRKTTRRVEYRVTTDPVLVVSREE